MPRVCFSPSTERGFTSWWGIPSQQGGPPQPPHPEGGQAAANTLATPVAAAKAPAGTPWHTQPRAQPSCPMLRRPCRILLCWLSFHEIPTVLIILLVYCKDLAPAWSLKRQEEQPEHHRGAAIPRIVVLIFFGKSLGRNCCRSTKAGQADNVSASPNMRTTGYQMQLHSIRFSANKIMLFSAGCH